MVDRREFVRGLPKAELHVHIEGTLEPEMMFQLAERNDVVLPFPDIDSLRRAYQFSDLQSFLDLYYAGAGVLKTTQDFHDLMAAYLDRAHADGVVRAEIFFDPQTHTDHGTGFDIFMPGFLSAIEAATANTGISVGLIMCFLRHLGPGRAEATWVESQPWIRQLLGVGLDSSERGFPPDPFAPVYARAATAGLRLVAHAGEEGPPAHIAASLDLLGCQRIDHGVRCEEDPELVRRLVAEQVPLTVCPLSNLALKGVVRLEDHNLKRLLDAGVRVTVNCDDPAYFGGYVAENYVAIADALELSDEDLVRLARNSLEAAFVDESQRAEWLRDLSKGGER